MKGDIDTLRETYFLYKQRRSEQEMDEKKPKEKGQLSEKRIQTLLKFGLRELSISGFKSFAEEKTIEIRPLTIFSGPNSSGKSSIMQPLLLMKQTLEESYDPGTLLLDGPNVRFTETKQILFNNGADKQYNVFSIGMKLREHSYKIMFEKGSPGFKLKGMEFDIDNKNVLVTPDMDTEQIKKLNWEYFTEDGPVSFLGEDMKLSVEKKRCFLTIYASKKFKEEKRQVEFGVEVTNRQRQSLANYIQNIIHLPGLRGIPERNYPTTSIESFKNQTFPGTFEKYVAGVINYWQEKEPKKLADLEGNIQKIGLTNKVRTKLIDDTKVGMFVGRSIKDCENDLVSIADVGLGVSQTLPVVVALLLGRPGTIVYIEQPEIHLHPKAQFHLAELIADSAKRGVKVIIETHSSILIKGIQTLVAEKELPRELVKLHWFKRNLNDGVTEVNSADLDENGSFGEWPEDFDETELYASSAYLEAIEKNLSQEYGYTNHEDELALSLEKLVTFLGEDSLEQNESLEEQTNQGNQQDGNTDVTVTGRDEE